ncbi:MAG: hypothetical protein K2X91_12455, partial [Thermoleophilia bacterium]|nr:hypothetical protein [Thermoleophilia bacterium]
MTRDRRIGWGLFGVAAALAVAGPPARGQVPKAEAPKAEAPPAADNGPRQVGDLSTRFRLIERYNERP